MTRLPIFSMLLLVLIGLQPSLSFRTPHVPGWRQIPRSVLFADIVDADFEKVDASQQIDDVFGSDESNDQPKFPESAFLKDPWSKSNTLIDMALKQAQESEFGTVPVDFFDAEERVIECTLAFAIELDDCTYGIGVPQDPTVMVMVEDRDGTVQYVDPDDDDSGELMEIMAGALHKHFGEDLNLTRTPRFLTIQGDLDKYVGNWVNDVFGVHKTSKEDFLADSDEDLDFFYNFMKEELGEEEFNKVMEGAEHVELDGEIVDLFPNLGSQQAVKDFVGDFNEEKAEQAVQELNSKLIEKDSIYVKLLSFNVKDGKSYSLVKPSQQQILVGRKTQEKGDLRFGLLSAEEAAIIIPRLEEVSEEGIQQEDRTWD